MLAAMPATPSPAHLRRRRTLRIAQLRQRVIAASVATFALAFALVASDGSMGSSTKASRAAAAAPSSTPPATDSFDDGAVAPPEQQFDDGGGGGGGGADVGGSSADPVQTAQS